MKKLLIIFILLTASCLVHAGVPESVAHALKKAGIPESDAAMFVQAVDASQPELNRF